MADEEKTGVYTVERVELDGSYVHSGWATVAADCPEEAAMIFLERIGRGELLDTVTEENQPDGEPVLIVRAVAGFYGRIADDLVDAIR